MVFNCAFTATIQKEGALSGVLCEGRGALEFAFGFGKAAQFFEEVGADAGE